MRMMSSLVFLVISTPVCFGAESGDDKFSTSNYLRNETSNFFQDKSSKPAELKTSEVRRIDFNVKKGSIGYALDMLSKEFGINYIADAYSDEPELPIHIKNASMHDILVYISKLFQRNIVLVGDVYVFRHLKGAGRTAEELVHRKQYPCEWPHAGKVLVKKYDVKTKPSVVRLSVMADAVSITNVAFSVSKESGWKLRIDPQFSERRVYSQMMNVTPGQFTESLTVLLQGNQQVTISQTQEQKVADNEEVEDALDNRSWREKESSKIRGDLEKLLSPEQFEDLNNGKEVPIKLDKLPKELKARVVSYIKTLSETRSALSSVDLSRIEEFAIVFVPAANAPGGALGVNGFLSGGGTIYF